MKHLASLWFTVVVSIPLLWLENTHGFVAVRGLAVRSCGGTSTGSSRRLLTVTTSSSPTTRMTMFPKETIPTLWNKNHPRRYTVQSNAVPLQAMPTGIPIEVLTCLLPTCGGFFSREFGVSYAYGAAVSLTAWNVLQQKILKGASITAVLSSSSPNINNWVAWHAAALIFYGIRLCLFLFYRQQTSQRIKEMRKRIEQRAESSGSRLSRTPFVLSCAYLYYGLCAPLYQSTALVVSQPPPSLLGMVQSYILPGLVALTWTGFLMAAAGDFTKSIVKTRKGEDHLVTGGIFRFLRHPNYTGEMIGWTANSVAGLISFLSLKQFNSVKSWWLLTSNLLGVLGINFVLMLATKNLEKRQADTYGNTEAYKTWVSKSWGGFALPKKQSDKTPHIELNDQDEQCGTGI